MERYRDEPRYMRRVWADEGVREQMSVQFTHEAALRNIAINLQIRASRLPAALREQLWRWRVVGVCADTQREYYRTVVRAEGSHEAVRAVMRQPQYWGAVEAAKVRRGELQAERLDEPNSN